MAEDGRPMLHAAMMGDSLALWSDPAGMRPPCSGAGVTQSASLWSPREIGGIIRLIPSPVAVSMLPVGEAVEALEEMVAQGCREYVLGEDARYWQQLACFARGLATRGRFRPALEYQGLTLTGRWRPWYEAVDERRLASLAHSMPGACRALSSSSSLPPATSPIRLSRTFVDGVVDHVVRAAAGRCQGEWCAAPEGDEAWMAALVGRECGLTLNEKQRASLEARYERWLRGASECECSELVFVVDDAPSDEGTAGERLWPISPFLRRWSKGRPSALVPLRDVLADSRRRAPVLREMARATWIWPPLEDVLASPECERLLVDDDGLLLFLSIGASSLKDADFGVALPVWWSNPRAAAGVSARASFPDAGANLGADALFKLDWSLAVGGRPLERAEVVDLLSATLPLVQVAGRWVLADVTRLRSALSYVDSRPIRVSRAELVRLALDTMELPAGVRFIGLEGDVSLKPVLEQLQHLQAGVAFEERPVPTSLEAELRPYQQRGYSWLSFLGENGLGACLADDMGLGKTVQALAYLEALGSGGSRAPSLVVCPLSVVGSWRSEVRRFSPASRVMIHTGQKRSKGEDFVAEAGQSDIVVTTYGILRREVSTLSDIHWSAVVLDEAQAIKNPRSKTSRAARGLKTRARVALTGTPVENNVGDLWGLMSFLNPGLLGTQASFRRRFFNPIERYRSADAANDLRRLVAPFVLRRLKSDPAIAVELPAKWEMKVRCTLTREQAALYEAVVEDALTRLARRDLEPFERQSVVLRTLTRLKLICNHPAAFLHDELRGRLSRSGKFQRFATMLESPIDTGEGVLVFTQFTETGHMLCECIERLFGFYPPFLHGGVPQERREEMVARFQDETGAPIFVVSLRAGGTGLTLHRANHVIHFDRWWNPAVEDQATDRAHRIGQTKTVEVHKFICLGTVEERIDALLEKKRETAAWVVGSGEAWLADLDTDELAALLKLGDDAVEEE